MAVEFSVFSSLEIHKRLSALNRQRWEEEEAKGLHKKGKK